MKKKILALLLVFALIFACVSIPVNAEGETVETPTLKCTEEISIVIGKDLAPSTADLSDFMVIAMPDTAGIIAPQDANKDNYSVEITSYTVQREGGAPVTLDAKALKESFAAFYNDANAEKTDITLTITVDFIFKSLNLFGNLNYAAGVTGFGDDAIVVTGASESFPTVAEIALHTAPSKTFYTDAETVALDGTVIVVTTSTGAKGLVAYSSETADLFATAPAAGETVAAGTTTATIYFMGKEIQAPITAIHTWSNPPANHLYTDADKGSHPGGDTCAICGAVNEAGAHVVDPNGWVVNNDVQPNGKATASQICKDCGCVLTKNVLVFNETADVMVGEEYIFSGEGLLSAGFDVELDVDDSKTVAFDGATTAHTAKIVSISAQEDGQPRQYYSEEYPDAFLNIFTKQYYDNASQPTTRPSTVIRVEVQFVYDYVEVFGELNYNITIKGFSAPPDLGISLGDAIAVPTDIPGSFNVAKFPKLTNLSQNNPSIKQFYLDSEKPELDGVSVNVETSLGLTGIVAYGNDNAHMFTTIPAKDAPVTVDTKEIATFFFDKLVTTLPISVEHDWSPNPVSITTDKYSVAKPGYHAIVCNGCGETHSPENHVPTPVLDADGNPTFDADGNMIQDWKYNNDQTFTSNGTESTACAICGGTLTRDVFGSADYNNAFANYHFLKVIFDYINLILRIIGGAVG